MGSCRPSSAVHDSPRNDMGDMDLEEWDVVREWGVVIKACLSV